MISVLAVNRANIRPPARRKTIAFGQQDPGFARHRDRGDAWWQEGFRLRPLGLGRWGMVIGKKHVTAGVPSEASHNGQHESRAILVPSSVRPDAANAEIGIAKDPADLGSIGSILVHQQFGI